MDSSASKRIALVAMLALTLAPTSAVLVQPYNYLLDGESSLVSQADSGSLSPFTNDQSGSSEQNADKDIITILGDSLARLRFARMLESSGQADEGAPNSGHLSAEMAEMIQEHHEANKQANEQSIGSSVANMLMNVAQAAAQASGAQDEEREANERQVPESEASRQVSASARGNIMELDTSAANGAAASTPSKSDLKSGPIQWFNPKETIPVLKISSMATPSKYKKVYFRSEKKLVDGAFHSSGSEQEEKKSLVKPFASSLQRRSSRGTSSSVAPPSFLQDGVIDFLKKFRDVYVQTRPAASSASASSSFASLASASSPFASVLAPASSGSRPNLSSALSAASSMVNSAVAQAASSGSSPVAAAATNAVAAAASGSSAAKPLSTQTYVSFWSKTFPTWVKKMLKQMRRRSLQNSNKRQQQQQQSALSHAAQAAASSAVASVVEQATGGSGSNQSS